MRAIPDWVITDQYADTALGVLKSGKEAEIFVVERTSLDGARRCLLAHKRYRPRSVKSKGELEALGFSRASSFVNDHVYHEGRRFRRSRERRAVERMTDYGKRILNDRWMGFELDVMTRVWEAGGPVPYPVEFSGDGMLLEYINCGRSRNHQTTGGPTREIPNCHWSDQVPFARRESCYQSAWWR